MQVLRTHRDTLLSVLETLVHDPLVEWVPKNAKSGAEEQENAMARDAMATIEGETPSFDHIIGLCKCDHGTVIKLPKLLRHSCMLIWVVCGGKSS